MRMSLHVQRLRLVRGATAIRPFVRSDLDALLALRIANREFLAPFEAERDSSFFTRAAQAREITLDSDAWSSGIGYAFAVLAVDDDNESIIGRVALSNVVRGPWQNATLGYWIAQDANGRGHATAAVALACEFGFDHCGLHRIQPAIMPRNERSASVVRRNGFRLEGRAERYLRIAGVWEDHDIYALTREEWPTQPRAE